MTRRYLQPMPVFLKEKRPALQPETWLTFLTLWGLTVNEWLGPAFLGLCLLLWSVYCLQNAAFLFRSLTMMGIVPWLMPVLALTSTLWSPVPDMTARAAIQLGITVALALMTAKAVAPRRFITILWVVMGIILTLSVLFNKPYYDAMTGRTTMGGVFGNKNTLSVCGASFALASASILLDHTRSLSFRTISFFCIGVGAVLCVLARSIGTISAMMVALTLLILIALIGFLPRRLRTFCVDMTLLTSVGIGGLLLLAMLTFRDELLALVGKDSTLTGRTILWFYAERIAQDYLPLGKGFQAFWVQGYPPAEFLWKIMHIEGRYGFHFHSLYYELLIQLGYAGVICSIIMLTYAVAVLVAHVRHNPDAPNGFLAAYALMFLITQWQAIGIYSQFDPSSYFFMVAVAYSAGCCRSAASLLSPIRVLRGHLPKNRGFPSAV